MIGDFIFIASCAVVYKSAAAIVYQRGTGLCGVGFETGVIAPGYVPSYGSYTWLRYAAAVELPLTTLSVYVISCAFIADFADKDA